MLISRHVMQKILQHAQEDPSACGLLSFNNSGCVDAFALPATTTQNLPALFDIAIKKASMGVYIAGAQQPVLAALTNASVSYCFWVALNEKGVLEVNAYQWQANAWQTERLTLIEEVNKL